MFVQRFNLFLDDTRTEITERKDKATGFREKRHTIRPDTVNRRPLASNLPRWRPSATQRRVHSPSSAKGTDPTLQMPET